MIRCLLCCVANIESTNRYLVGGKGKVDFCASLQALDIPFQQVADNLKKSKDKIRTIFYKRGHELNLKRASIDLNRTSSIPMSDTPAKKVCLHGTNAPLPLCTSTPVKHGKSLFTDQNTAAESKTETEVKVL